MKSFISLDSFSNSEILEFCKLAREYSNGSVDRYSNLSIASIFLEDSTRTKCSFDLASKKLGLDFVDLDVNRSSLNKNEDIIDTITTIDAMGFDLLVIRSKDIDMKSLDSITNANLINAGEGTIEHPSQALGDLFTLFNSFGDINGLRVAIVGDILHSRVASSHINLLPRFGVNLSIITNQNIRLNRDLKQYSKIDEVKNKVDVVMMLRNQFERHNDLSFDIDEYKQNYTLTKDLLNNSKIKFMHPGPVNWNIDIDKELLFDSRSLIAEQVKNSISVRMAIISKTLNG